MFFFSFVRIWKTLHRRCIISFIVEPEAYYFISILSDSEVFIIILLWYGSTPIFDFSFLSLLIRFHFSKSISYFSGQKLQPQLSCIWLFDFFYFISALSTDLLINRNNNYISNDCVFGIYWVNKTYANVTVLHS